MVIMALDHVRDYFHLGAIVYDPTDMDTTTPQLFFTRFVTHFCAPVFIFLTGTSASLFGQNKSKATLSRFLWTRGLWLIFVEIVIMNLLWWFNPRYEFINLQVIWAIGLCMICLSALIYLPRKVLIILSLIVVFGHNTLDGITAEGNSIESILWYIVHQHNFIEVGESRLIGFYYPIVPWFAVMALGYCFGFMFHKGYPVEVRKRHLLQLGFASIALFLLIRGINIYGDPSPWKVQKDGLFTFMSFINVSKYPPSLLYILITIGPTFIVLYLLEGFKNRSTDFLIVFGRVPFFYYILHILIIHSAALLTLAALGKDWRLMIFTRESFMTDKLANYGYSLGAVYLVWILVVAFLYPLSKKYMTYKLVNKDKWWLSYL
jgi:uncharacterized membrane protein